MIPPGRLTLEEFLTLPEQKPPLEYFNGEVTPRCEDPEADSALVLLTELFVQQVNLFAEPRGLGKAFVDARGTFGGVSFVPPAGFYGAEKLKAITEEPPQGGFRLPWDLVLDLDFWWLPGNNRDAEQRARWYCDNGVSVVLLVDPDFDWIVLRFTPGRFQIPLINDESLGIDEALPGFSLSPLQLLKPIWRD